MKTREQNENNKRTEIERFDWFIERIQTRVAFGWLSESSGEKSSRTRTFDILAKTRSKMTTATTFSRQNEAASPASTT